MHLLFIQKMEQQLPSSSIIFCPFRSDIKKRTVLFLDSLFALFSFHAWKKAYLFQWKDESQKPTGNWWKKASLLNFRGVQLAFLCGGDTMMQVTSLPVTCSPPSPTTSKHQIKCPEAVPETVSFILVWMTGRASTSPMEGIGPRTNI